jgi:hypothetical protein
MARSRTAGDWKHRINNMGDGAQPDDIRIVGSAHSGLRGDFRPQLFQIRRTAGPVRRAAWEVTPIHVDGPTGEVRIMGLAIGPSGLLAVAGSKELAFLATFDQRLEQTGWHDLSGVTDPHGLILEAGLLWVVSSGSNEVIRYRMSAAGPSAPKKVFQHPSGEPQHFNGIARHGDRLVLSAFGVGASAVREVRNTGYLVDIECGAPVRTGLDQPHSPLSRDGALLFCESNCSLVWHENGASFRLEGYLRGFAIASDGIMHVARSSPRPPREELTADRPDAAIWSVTPNGSVLSCDKLTGIGAEIYDLIALPDGWPEGRGAPGATTA